MHSLFVLGSGASILTSERACSGVMLGNKLLDCGFGVLANLRRSKIDLDRIDEFYITHTHADHIGDFTGILWAMQLEGRRRPLRIVCSRDTSYVLSEIIRLHSTPKDFIKYELTFLRPEEIGVRYCKTRHEPENLAYRLKIESKEIVYTGDTGYSSYVIDLSKDADVLIHESTFLKGQESYAERTNHSTVEDAARVAQSANARRLILTHLSPFNSNKDKEYLEEAKRIYDGEVIVARDLLSIEL